MSASGHSRTPPPLPSPSSPHPKVLPHSRHGAMWWVAHSSPHLWFPSASEISTSTLIQTVLEGTNQRKNAIHFLGFESSLGFITSHRVILVTLEVSSLPQHVKHIQLDPVPRAMSKFWTLPRWRCPRCSGQPPASDDIHGKKVFLHLTGISHLATCACCTQSCHHKPLRRVELLVLCILPAKRSSLSPSQLLPEHSVLQPHSTPAVNQCFRGTFIAMEPPKLFLLAVPRHRCTPKMKDLLPGEVQLSCSNQLCAHFSSHTGKWNQTNKSWSQQTADNGESLSYGNTASCGHKPETATFFLSKPNTALDLFNKEQSGQIFPQKPFSLFCHLWSFSYWGELFFCLCPGVCVWVVNFEFHTKRRGLCAR